MADSGFQIAMVSASQAALLSDPVAEQQLQQALAEANALLGGLPARGDGVELLLQAFDSAGTDEVEFQGQLQALVALLQADGLGLTAELRSGAEMGGALGAYAASGPDGSERLYLNADWIRAGASVEAIVRVLLEESGHAIDQRLNAGGDAAGDEGELFAALLTGAELSEEQRAAILADNDAGLLWIDGQPIAVEYDKVTTIDAVTFSSDSGSSSSDRITNAASQTVTVTTVNLGNQGSPDANAAPILYYSTDGGGTRTLATLTAGSWTNNGTSNTTATFTFSVTLSGTGTLKFYTASSGGSAINLTGSPSTTSFSYTIDAAAPAAPTITSAALTNDATPVISGTAEASSTITLTVAGATYTTTASAGGAWSVDTGSATPSSGALAINANGNNSVSVTATDTAGNVSTAATQTLVVDTTAPTTGVTIQSIAQDSGASSSDFITKDNNGLTISASLSAALATGETLQYSNNNGSSWINVSVTDISGTSVSLVDATLTTSRTIQFRVVDAAGNAGTAASQLITIDTTSPVLPVISSAEPNGRVSAEISGTAEAGSTLTVSVAGAVYTTTANGSGAWSLNTATATVTSGTLALTGNDTVSVTATDAAGNVSGAATQALLLRQSLSSTTLGSTAAVQILNRQAAEQLALTVTYNQAAVTGEDVLVAAFSGSTLIGWTIYNRKNALATPPGSPVTATLLLPFNLAQFNTDIPSGGITFRVWQGKTSAGGPAEQNDLSSTTSGSTATVDFGINSTSAETTTLSSATAGGTSATWANTSFDVTPPATTVTITAIAEDSGASSSDFITSDNNGLTIAATLSAALTVGETLQYSNNDGSSWVDVSATDISGAAVSLVDAALTTSRTIQFRVVDAVGNAGTAASQLVTIDTQAPESAANTLTLANDSGSTGDGITRNIPEFRLGSLQKASLTNKFAVSDRIQIGYQDASGNFVVVAESRRLTADDFAANGNLKPGGPVAGLGEDIRISLPQDFAPGGYALRLRVVDAAGNLGPRSDDTFVLQLLDPADQPYLDVFAAALDPSGITVGTAVAGYYLYDPERLAPTALTVDFLDPTDKSSGLFEIDASASVVRLTTAGFQAYALGQLSLPKSIQLTLVGAGAPQAAVSDADIVVAQYAPLVSADSLYFIDFVDAWLGTPVDRSGRPLSGANPNQFNYFKSSAQLDPSGNSFRFVAAADQTGAVGNNVIGTLYVLDASGQQIGASIQGVLSRVNKSLGQVQAVYFYEGTDYPTTLQRYDPSKKLLLLDLREGIQISSDKVYRTSSDLPRTLFTQLSVDVNSIDINEGTRYALFNVALLSGQDVSLQLEDGSGDVLGNSAAIGGSTDPKDGSVDFRNDNLEISLDNGASWLTYATGSSFPASLAERVPRMLVRVALFNDPVYEDAQNFRLKVAYTGVGFGGLSDSGTGVIHDDGTGDLLALDGSGNPLIDASGHPVLDGETTKDDDRPLSVIGGLYNEGSSFLQWTATGAAGQRVVFAGPPTAGAGTSPVVGPSGDITGVLESFTGGSWTLFDASSSAVLDASGQLQIRTRVNNDTSFEGVETFVLTVRNTGGADASGVSSLQDDGSGTVIDASGNLDGSAIRDDDRPLHVDGAVFNEGSPYLFWRVSGQSDQAGQRVLWSSPLAGDRIDATVARDLSGALQYFDGNNWLDFDTSSNAVLDASGLLLFRSGVVNDALDEGLEGFWLTVRNSGGVEASGVSSLVDDGTGLLPTLDGSGTPLVFDASGLPVDGSGNGKDDDRRLTVNAFGPFNELSKYAVFSVKASAGRELNLEIGNTASLLDNDATISDFPAFEYFDETLATPAWVTYSWNGSTGARPLVGDNGTVLVRVDITSEQDSPYEGPETFTLSATYASGAPARATGIATIIDNGSGDIVALDQSGNPQIDASGILLVDLETAKDDDRSSLSIPDVNVNEASSDVVFQIFGTGGKTYRLRLSDGAVDFMEPNDTGTRGQQMAVGTSGVDPSGYDYRNEIQVYNGSTWVPYVDASGVATAPGSSVLLVRVPLINDSLYEGAHAFTLIATDLSGNTPAVGRAIISDFATGAIFNDSGNENRTAIKDDDRALKVDSPVVNEASDFVVFRIRGITSAVQLNLLFGNGTGFAALPTPNLQYWSGSAWVSYTPAALLVSGTTFSTGSDLYVRVAIQEEQDDAYEGSERFTLDVSGAGGPSQGVATIRDDGTGVIPVFDGSGNLLLDLSGNPLLDAQRTKDDDLDKDGITPTTEEALSTLAASQNIPGAKPGDLNGDGIPDAEQNALATLAWRDRASFDAGNDGTLTDYRPVVSLSILADASGSTVSNTLQLENVRVLDYNDPAEFPDASGAVTVDASGTRTIALAGGGTVTTIWDPIRFEIAPQNGTPGLIDVDLERPGTQIRLYVDMRASNLDASTFNSYAKYVSREAIDASGDLIDLSGAVIATPGWYDFTRRTSGGDGARFVVSGGKIQGIDLIFTDNAFGDDNPSLDRISDPGAPAFLPPVPPPQLVTTKDGKGLKLIGSEGQSLWLDLSAILSSGLLQNAFNLIRRTYAGGCFTDTPVGAIGATVGNGLFGDTRILLNAGQELRFALKSANNPLVAVPKLKITGQGECYVIRLEDSVQKSDDDYNDLVISVKGVDADPMPLATQMASLQTSVASPYLDLRWITAPVTLAVDVQTDNSSRDVLRLVRLDPAKDFNLDGTPKGTVGGVSPGAGRAFEQAVKSALVPSFAPSRSTPGVSNLSLSLTDPGVYLPVLFSSAVTLYNSCLQSKSEAWQRVKVMGANSFGFEAPTKSGPDWDFNDLTVTFRLAEPSRPTLAIAPGGRSLQVTGGQPGEGLWLDLSAVFSSSTWQNNLDLIKVSDTNQRSAVGSIGTTANAIPSRSFGVYGTSALFLQTGESLEFRENSNDNPVGNSPLLRITQVGERFVVAMDDRLGGRSKPPFDCDDNLAPGDGDYNDLVLTVDYSVVPACSELDALTSFQRTSADGVLDLSAIGPSGVRLLLQINTDSLNANTLGFVRLDGGGDNDPLTNPTVFGNLPSATASAFRAAIKSSLSANQDFNAPADPLVSLKGVSSQTVRWDFTAPGFYAPVLFTPSGQVFTFGDATASDCRQHLKLLGDNAFGFEEFLASQRSDFDYNDVTVQVLQINPLA